MLAVNSRSIVGAHYKGRIRSTPTMISPSNAQLQAMVTTLSMFSLFVLVGFAVFMPVDGHGRHTKRNLPALNTQVTNNIANGADGPQLYYNGSGNVPG